MPLQLLLWIAASWLLVFPADKAKDSGERPRVAVVQVKCAGERHFLLRIQPQRVKVVVDRRSFELRRQPSSLGYYRSGDTTLIIYGDFVAFVSRGNFGWQNCHIERPRDHLRRMVR